MPGVNKMFYIISAVLLFIYYQKNITEFIENHKDGDPNASTFEIFYGHSKNLDDVIGNDEAKDDISDIIDMIKYPEKYINMGSVMPKGVLLYGPPGTGKTLMVKALAKESNLPLINTTGSSFCEMYVGVGAARVKKLFKLAKKIKPCIVFIDEIDAVGRSRSKDNSGGDTERATTLNQLLTEIDGFVDSNGIIVIGATNKKNLLDDALLRAGRFDRHVNFILPDKKDRFNLLKYYLKNKKKQIDERDIYNRYSKLCIGMTGADISGICNEASILAVRRDKTYIENDDILDAYENKVLGKKKKKDNLTLSDKRIIAYHEAGHCFLQYYLKYIDEPNTVSIEPRVKTALGFSQSLPRERVLNSKQEIIHEVAVLLGGRLVENKLNNNLVTTGAYDDLRKIKKLAKEYISLVGFDKEIGSCVVSDDASDQFKYDIERRCMVFIKYVEDKARDIIDEYYEYVERLAGKLLESNRLHIKDIGLLLGGDLKKKGIIVID
tara:strand:+ start:43 stop:1521 length:1479 start_codon:yes stop_codon:yes gene_type:complete